MNQNYEIDLYTKNGIFKVESCYGLNLNVFENDHDIDIKTYNFNSDYTDSSLCTDVNLCVNYLLLEIYNGTRLLVEEQPFIPHYQNTSIKTLGNHLKAYKIINEIKVKPFDKKASDSDFKKIIYILMNDKNIRDMVILLNRVYNFDENSLINYYKILDFVKTYKDLMKKYNSDSKNYIGMLEQSYKKLCKFSQSSNTYLSTGLAARHGLKTQLGKKFDIDNNELLDCCIQSVLLVINISKQDKMFEFNNMVSRDLENKRKKK